MNSDSREWTIHVCVECDQIVDECRCSPLDYYDSERRVQGAPSAVVVRVVLLQRAEKAERERDELAEVARDVTDCFGHALVVLDAVDPKAGEMVEHGRKLILTVASMLVQEAA